MSLHNLLDLGVADDFLWDVFHLQVKMTKRGMNGHIISVQTPHKALLIKRSCSCRSFWSVVDFYRVIIIFIFEIMQLPFDSCCLAISFMWKSQTNDAKHYNYMFNCLLILNTVFEL